MSETLGSNAVAEFQTPTSGDASSEEMRDNLNTLGAAITAHDADPSIHFLSGATLAARPAATGSYRKWLDRATGRVYVDTAASTWTEIRYLGLDTTGVVTTEAGFTGGVRLSGTHQLDRDAALIFEETNVLPTVWTYVRGGTNGFVVENQEDGSSVVPTLTVNATGVANLPAATGRLQINGTQVVGPRKTGWATATGTATRTTFDTATVTTTQLAERVKALLDDLHSAAGHGLLGT
jgi:hypothetical protein